MLKSEKAYPFNPVWTKYLERRKSPDRIEKELWFSLGLLFRRPQRSFLYPETPGGGGTRALERLELAAARIAQSVLGERGTGNSSPLLDAFEG